VEKAQRIMREAPEKIKDIETGKKTANKAMLEKKELAYYTLNRYI
jgi:hypothetical protein